ncbi:MAG: hypothetical protein M3150_07670, partial [Pseudomonadota bacterium]|nr:hypothetical protein [Pseudomonadota bacterium]
MRRPRTFTTVAIVVLALLGVLAWLHDFFTLDGARTVYTADCGGQWRGAVCAGTMRAGNRYRFRAFKPRGEVIFWVALSPDPSGKLAPCVIENAKQWSCKQGPDSRRTITHEMKFGHPVHEARGPALAFHPVSKLKWLLLDAGV